ncbi:hypothetical protein [uncultured Senegalimassilia sp.]|uniref:hypothetical protein n=1 Tax=uncultured Senegalimassilia sp. TaxID=1714350 RepID=UPI00267499A3|nr:hypothetical protein [uncultured Senegalimassilia sp.]
MKGVMLFLTGIFYRSPSSEPNYVEMPSTICSIDKWHFSIFPGECLRFAASEIGSEIHGSGERTLQKTAAVGAISCENRLPE